MPGSNAGRPAAGGQSSTLAGCGPGADNGTMEATGGPTVAFEGERDHTAGFTVPGVRVKLP